MKKSFVYFCIFWMFSGFPVLAQKQYIWKPRNYVPVIHSNVLNGDTVYLSFEDKRIIPSNSKVSCSSEELIDFIRSQVQIAYPKTVFLNDDNRLLNINQHDKIVINIEIRNYSAIFSSMTWTGSTTFETSVYQKLSGVEFGHKKESSYYSYEGNFLGFKTAKKCLSQSYVAAFEDMCSFIDGECAAIKTKISQIKNLQEIPSLSPMGSNSAREKLVAPEILARISVSNSLKELSPKDIYKKYNNAVFLIYTNNGEQIAQGSGFIVSNDGIAVSNYHVFKDTYKGLEIVKFPNGETYKIKEVYGFSEKYDYIVFKLDGYSFDYIPVHIGDIEIGDEVFAIGSPRGLVNTISNGLISQHHDGFIYQISVPIDHGSSGGALINKYGEVIGITSGGIDTSQANLNFAYDIKAIFSRSYND